MTAPIVHGYPDWGRFAARADVIYISDTSVVIGAGDKVYDPIFVGNVRHLGFIFNMVTNNAAVRLDYYNDENLSTILGTQTIKTRVGGGFDFSLPVQGPWVQVFINFNATPAEYDLYMFSVSGNIASIQNGPAPIRIIGVGAFAIGAGATVTLTSSRSYPGEAMWSVSSALATWTALLDTIDDLGVTNVLDAGNNTLNPLNRRVWLPAEQCRLRVTNTTAGAGTFTAAVVSAGMVWPTG